jgi:two-component sensor histidine kinase
MAVAARQCAKQLIFFVQTAALYGTGHATPEFKPVREKQVSDSQAQAVEKLKLQRAALADFGLLAFRCDDIDNLLHRASELVAGALGVPFVKVLEHHPARGEMLIRSGVNWQPGVVGHESFGDHERSPGGYALRSDQPVVSPDLSRENRFDTPDVLLRHGVKSMVNVIIAGSGAPYGVLEVDAQEPREFSNDDVAFLRTYANLLAAAIERVRSHDQLRSSAREQSVLARELGHRVRNLLGLVRALASQTSAKNRTGEEFRHSFVDRLQALSVAESLVFESRNERADLLKLAHEVLAPHRRDDRQNIAIDGVSVGLSERQSRMFGLALHELATNAAKYGALGAADGMVAVEWHLESDAGAGRQLSMTWQEADGPEINPPERKGFGTRLLKDVVSHELNGEAELVYEPGGLRYNLKFPVGGE